MTAPAAWSDHPFLVAVADELAGRFIPRPPPLYDGDCIGLYEAVRRAAGLDPELGLVAWRNHGELREAIGQLHQRLDWALDQHFDGTGRAETWALAAGRTEEEVVALLAAATDPACPIGPINIPTPQSRALPHGISGVGKYRGAVVAQLAALRPIHASYGELIGEMLSESAGDLDSDILNWTEQQPTAPTIDYGPFPAQLTKVAGTWLGQHAGGTMSKFLRVVSDDWRSLDDLEAGNLLEAFHATIRSLR